MTLALSALARACDVPPDVDTRTEAFLVSMSGSDPEFSSLEGEARMARARQLTADSVILERRAKEQQQQKAWALK